MATEVPDDVFLAAKDQIIAVLETAYDVFDPYDEDPDLNGFSHYNLPVWERLPENIRKLIEPEEHWIEEDDEDGD